MRGGALARGRRHAHPLRGARPRGRPQGAVDMIYSPGYHPVLSPWLPERRGRHQHTIELQYFARALPSSVPGRGRP